MNGISPVEESMNELLKSLVIEIEENRKSDSPVKSAWVESCKRIGLELDNPFVQFGLKCANHPDLIHSDNKYHNHLHASDAIISASFLAKEEFTADSLKINGALLLFSMMFHDIAHNGGHNHFDYELEQAAVDSMNEYINDNQHLLVYWNNKLKKTYGDWATFSKTVESVILGTDFKNGPAVNLKNYNEQPIDVNKVRLLANEADILPSCTSILGPKLGLLLSEELNKPVVGTWQGREFFISKLAKLGSMASRKLEIQQHVDRQLEIINIIGIAELDRKSEDGNFLKVAEYINNATEEPLNSSDISSDSGIKKNNKNRM
jgi:hypothetical protein